MKESAHGKCSEFAHLSDKSGMSRSVVDSVMRHAQSFGGLTQAASLVHGRIGLRVAVPIVRLYGNWTWPSWV